MANLIYHCRLLNLMNLICFALGFLLMAAVLVNLPSALQTKAL